MRPYRCVKCAGDHKTSECTKKDRNTPATCALCLGNHPANYKGCQVYKEIMDRKLNKGQNMKIKSTIGHNDKETQISSKKQKPQYEPIVIATNDNHQTSYSDIVKETRDQQRSQSSNHLEMLLMKQSEKIDMLVQQICNLLSLITTLISNGTKQK